MAKLELPVYDMSTGEKVKTLQRNVMPVGLYIRFQELSEKLQTNEITKDRDMFEALRDLLLETFPELTAEEYMNGVDVADALVIFRDILNKATKISAGNSKN